MGLELIDLPCARFERGARCIVLCRATSYQARRQPDGRSNQNCPWPPRSTINVQWI